MASAPITSMHQVLLVDDDEVSLEYLARALRRYFLVLVAQSAFEALRTLEQMPIDTLVTDFELRTENGLWLLDQARTRFPQTRRLLVSGFPLKHVTENRAAGLFEQFLPKPLRLMSLVTAIEQRAA